MWAFLLSVLQNQQLRAAFFKVLPLLAGIAISQGLITREQWDALVAGYPQVAGYGGVLLAVVTGVYSWIANRRQNVIAQAAAIPGAVVHVADPVLAEKAQQVDPRAADSIVKST